MYRVEPDSLPAVFTRNIVDLYGEKGSRWLSELPAFIAEIAERWSIVPENHFPDLSYHYVAPCTCADGTKAVLKLACPETEPILFSEAKILKLLDGRGSVRLLKFDEKLCALLLERLLPGENLVGLCRENDAQATAIAIQVMKDFRQKAEPDSGFPDLAKWTSGLKRGRGTGFPQDLIEGAVGYLEELSAGSGEDFLLHGDLHHQNILSAERAPFLVIDPKGIIGKFGFEISVFLNNPRSWVLNHPNREEVLKKRLKMFAESFEIAPEELRKWAYSEAVLSAFWTFEDNGAGYEKWLACARMWEDLKI